MKGAILSLNDQVHIVDVHHQIPPFDIVQAAHTVDSYYKCFPDGTIHLCVVDPGVGSARRPIIVRVAPYFFVGPDNGIFSAVYRSAPRMEVVHITATHYFRHPVSATFHGRDIFAPVAARLSMGVPMREFGEVIEDYELLSLSSPVRVSEAEIEGEIVTLDSFGNAITNITGESVEYTRSHGGFSKATITVGAREIPHVACFADAVPGSLSAVTGSSGYIELFLYQGSASVAYSLKPAQRVRVLFS